MPGAGAKVRGLETLGGRLKCDAVSSILHHRVEMFSHRVKPTSFTNRLPPAA